MHKIAYNNCFGGFELSEAAIQWLINHGKTREWCNSCEYFYNLRHDPLLIECIETLGTEQVSGHCSLITIAEIDCDYYQIYESEGCEKVITPENIDWICIK